MDKLYPRDTVWARGLRRAETPAEVALWALLRDRQLLGQKFRRQHPIGRFFADFYCAAARLAIETDGSSHDGRALRDRRRDAYFRGRGITLLRFPNHQVLQQPCQVLEQIRRALTRQLQSIPERPQTPAPLSRLRERGRG